MTPTEGEIDDLVGATLDVPVPVADLADGPPDHATIARFREVGVLVVRRLLGAPELAGLDEATRVLIDAPPAERTVDHVMADLGGAAGPDLYKVDYLLDKDPAFRRTAGHPGLLQLVEAIVGPSFLPTWETLVLKGAERGPRIPWHRDCAVYDAPLAVGGSGRLVDVGIYLDDSTPDNGVRCLPGSCYWPVPVAAAAIERLNRTWGAVPGVSIPARRGDLVLHNVLTLHSAPEVEASERRVIYYEYRPSEVEVELGPHTVQFVAEKQRVLTSCIDERRSSPLGVGEVAHRYRPPAAMDLRHLAASTGSRIRHGDHWTWAHVDPVPR